MNISTYLKNIFIILLFVTTIFFTKSCGTASFGQRADSLFLSTSNSEYFYDLKRPDEKYFLPYVLAEISGLTFTENGTLLAVDDETGKVFEYDVDKKDIVHSIEFAKPGDYEGVEIVDGKIFVLESDGDIYQFDYTDAKKVKAKKIENKLERSNDTEGLGYDPESGKLLIACKEKGEVNKNDAKGRAVYSLNTEKEKLSKDPKMSIRSKDLKNFWEENKDFQYEQERIKFKPSAIAYHPIEERFYILA